MLYVICNYCKDRRLKPIFGKLEFKSLACHAVSSNAECSYVKDKLAVTCDFQQFCILTSVDSDEPLQPPF